MNKGIVPKQCSEVLWEIPTDFRSDMRVPARIFATAEMMQDIKSDRSIEQLVNVTTLPGIRKMAVAMPDIHEGYGFPIGAVAVTKWPDGAISPGGIGYDINCGVRMLKSDVALDDAKPYLDMLASELSRAVPSGTGRGGRIALDTASMDKVLSEGMDWAVLEGYCEHGDQENIESRGKLENARPDAVSQHARKRGVDQLGTMGSGNHFVEVDYVDRIFDADIARSFGLYEGQIVVLIHCGSRGLGHQVATDYIRIMLANLPKHAIILPDRELACAPFSSSEGREYFDGMAAAANFAWVNRQIIAWEIRNEWVKIFGKDARLTTLYDVAHNIAKIEEHEIDGGKQQVIVHRKGATRAFGPGHPEIVEHYRATGQPVMIPGSMGTASYVMAGGSKSMAESFGSCCHGAGRTMSRHAAKKEIGGRELLANLRYQGIIVKAGKVSDLSEEAPFAYKDVHNVVDVVERAGLANKVASLKPLVVVKG